MKTATKIQRCNTWFVDLKFFKVSWEFMWTTRKQVPQSRPCAYIHWLVPEKKRKIEYCTSGRLEKWAPWHQNECQTSVGTWGLALSFDGPGACLESSGPVSKTNKAHDEFYLEYHCYTPRTEFRKALNILEPSSECRLGAGRHPLFVDPSFCVVVKPFFFEPLPCFPDP